MPNLNVGLGLVVLVGLPSFASEYTEFYDIEDNWIDTQNDGLNGEYSPYYLRVSAYEPGCAWDQYMYNSPSTGATIYSCNGGCTSYSATEYNIVNILPNGSYFEASNGTNYVCDASGEWIACETHRNTSSGDPAIVNMLTLRKYCSTGYKEASFGNDEYYFGDVDAEDFCSDPYYYWNEVGSLAAPHSIAQSCSSSGYYSACASGYMLSGTSCVSCGSLSNGGYNKAEWHTLTTCNPYCNDGYGYQASTQMCIAGSLGQVHMANYDGEENDWRDCPDGALCDADGWMWCPVGSFVAYNTDSDDTPWCQECPGAYGMAVAVASGLESDGTSIMCDGDVYGWGKGIDTDCLWSDMISPADDWTSVCYLFRGYDVTGTFEYKDYNDEWSPCEWE